MKKVEAIYDRGVLRLINPAKIDSAEVIVKIINRDEILTEEDARDVLEALREHSEGKTKKFEEVFD